MMLSGYLPLHVTFFRNNCQNAEPAGNGQSCTTESREKCSPVSRQVCQEERSQGGPNCRLVEKSKPQEVCQEVEIPKCQPVLRDICEVVTRQQCTSVTEEVPFDVSIIRLSKNPVKKLSKSFSSSPT
jgi:hypothetical protein